MEQLPGDESGRGSVGEADEAKDCGLTPGSSTETQQR